MEFEAWTSAKLHKRHGCTLQISGMNFDPEAFLKDSKIPENRVLLRGLLEIPGDDRKKLEANKISGQQGLDKLINLFDRQNLLISVSDEKDLTSQIEDAMLFLTTYQVVLKELTRKTEIADLILKFNPKRDDVFENFSDFPPEFYNLATECEIKSIGFG